MSLTLDSSPSDVSLWQRAQAELTEKERDQLGKVRVDDSATSALLTLESTKISLEKPTRLFCDQSIAITLPSGQNGAKCKVLLRDIFWRAIEWLNVVTSVGDKVVQFDTSEYAALPWVGVKLLVELVTSDVKKYDSILEGIGTIVHNLTFYAEWQKIYTNRLVPSDALALFHDALVKLFTLQCCVIKQLLCITSNRTQ